jgi:predicted PurR-regulated permease PerM
MENRNFYRAAFILVLAVGILTLYLTKEFIVTIVMALFVAYLLNPIYRYLLKHTGRKNISSVICLLLLLFSIIFIVFGAMNVLAIEMTALLSSIPHSNLSAFLGEFANQLNQVADKMPESIAGYIRQVTELQTDFVNWGLGLALASVSALAEGMPVWFAHFLVIVFFTHYMLVDGSKIIKRTLDLAPERRILEHFFFELNRIYNSLFTVYVTTSLLSGVLAVIGFSILGVDYPVIWGALVAVFTLIPLLGPIVIFGPMTIYYLLVHEYLMAILIFIFGVVALTVFPENVIRPKLAMQGAEIHPIITILAYTAPLFVIGVAGVIIGPTVYGFLLASIRTWIYFKETRSMTLSASVSSGGEGGEDGA